MTPPPPPPPPMSIPAPPPPATRRISEELTGALQEYKPVEEL